MFSREDLECLDPGYFEIICMDDRDVTIMYRNTRHMWYIHNPEYPLMGSCIIHPTAEKVEAIKDALKHFEVI